MDKQLKILILEDLQEDIWLVKRVLTKDGMDFLLEEVDTKEDFVSALKSFSPDIVLSDHSLPQFNSIEALKICQQYQLDLPFILVTGTVSEEFAVNSLKQGADDYVLKSNLERLPSAIKHAIKQREDEKKRKEAELKLRFQNEELLKINNELDSFVYNISHNLRAPLLSALGLVRLAKIEIKTDQYESMTLYCEKIEESVLKLDETLKEILDYSRNARSEIKYETIDFRRVIEDSLSKMKYLTNPSDTRIITDLRQTVPFATDNYRLNVIFNNLLSNALKYHDPKKHDKWIKIETDVDETKAVITISDNGIGIEKEYIPQIFDMFYRATVRSDGSGLGLYIVKEDVGKLGGNIKVTSAPRIETSFEITLPNHHSLVS